MTLSHCPAVVFSPGGRPYAGPCISSPSGQIINLLNIEWETLNSSSRRNRVSTPAARSLAEGASEQAASLEETSASLEEMAEHRHQTQFGKRTESQ